MYKTDAWKVGRSQWFIILKALTKLSNFTGWEWERFGSAQQAGQACISVNTPHEWGSCLSQECLSYLPARISHGSPMRMFWPQGRTTHDNPLLQFDGFGEHGGTTSLHFYFDTTIRIILSSKSTLNPIGFSFSDKPKKGCLFRIISSWPSSFTFCSRTDREHCKWGSFTWSTRVKYDGIPSSNSRAPEALWREEPVLGNMKLQL